MIRRPLRPLLALSLLVVAAAPARAQEDDGVRLRPAWTEGQTALYDFWTLREQTATVSFRGREQTTSNTYESTGQTRWTVNEVRDDGTVEATMTLDWIRVAITGPNGQEAVNDTRRGSGDVPAYHELLSALTEVPVEVVVAANGVIEEVTNFDRIKSRYKGEGEFPLSEADFRESATDLAVVPGAPAVAEVGDTWKQTFDWSHELGTMEQRVTFRLAGVEDVDGIGLATVTGEGELRLDFDRSKLGEGAPDVTVRLADGDFQAQILYDLDRHEAVGRNSVQNETIEMTMKFPQATVNRRMEQRIQSQVLRVEEGNK